MKEIKNFIGYFVGRSGNVFSIKQGKFKQLKTRKDRCGYISYMLRLNKVPISVLAHRIVANAFIPNTENKKTVNHINGIKSDNRVENLEWATHSENIIHGIKLSKRVPKNRKVPEELLVKIKKDLMPMRKGLQKEISIKYNIPYKIINRIKLNKYYK